jgi:hypothetical protein
MDAHKCVQKCAQNLARPCPVPSRVIHTKAAVPLPLEAHCGIKRSQTNMLPNRFAHVVHP